MDFPTSGNSSFQADCQRGLHSTTSILKTDCSVLLFYSHILTPERWRFVFLYYV